MAIEVDQKLIFPDQFDLKENPDYDDALMIYDAKAGKVKQTKMEAIQAAAGNNVIGSMTPSGSPSGSEVAGQSYRVSNTTDDVLVFPNFLDSNGDPVQMEADERSGYIVKNADGWAYVDNTEQADLSNVVKKTTDLSNDLAATPVPSTNAVDAALLKVILAAINDASRLTNVSDNIIDITRRIDGYSLNQTTGAYTVNANASVLVDIFVKPGTTYTKNNNQQVVFKDINRKFISGIAFGAAAKSPTTPANCYYMDINEVTAELPQAQMNEGSTLKPYDAYKIGSPIFQLMAKQIKEVIDGVISNNIFNKAVAVPDTYVNYSTGSQSVSTGYSSIRYISAKPNTTYVKNSNQQIAFFKADKTYLGGVATGLTYTTPALCTFVSQTTLTADLDTEQLNEGATLKPYDPYMVSPYFDKIGVDYNYLLNKPNIPGNYYATIHVAKSGGDYTTITDAINNAGDTSTGRVAIIVHPGTYVEALHLINRNIALIGTDRDSCIIRDDTGDYYNAPLRCSGDITCMNLSFIATHIAPNTHSLWSYGVHMDDDGVGTMRFINCYFESQQNSAIGIGMHQDQHIILEYCELVLNKIGAVDVDYTSYDGGSLYAHTNNSIGVSGQKLTVIGCRIRVLSTGAGSLKSVVLTDQRYTQGDDIDSTVTFINNMAWGDAIGKGSSAMGFQPPISGGISGKIKLTPDSYGNNVAVLNA